jgi:hypothetical protein
MEWYVRLGFVSDYYPPGFAILRRDDIEIERPMNDEAEVQDLGRFSAEFKSGERSGVQC